jgi:hypothetical protein
LNTKGLYADSRELRALGQQLGGEPEAAYAYSEEGVQQFVSAASSFLVSPAWHSISTRPGFTDFIKYEPGFKANVKLPRIGAQMRSKLVYSAGLKIENRFLLSATVMRAVRKLHVSSSRTEDTLNRVFADVAEGRYIDVTLPEIAPPPAIDALVVIAPLV